MKPILLSVFLAAALSANPRSSAGAEKLEDSKQLTLRIYNYAEVQDEILSQAKRESNRIFRQSGIETNWLDCPTSPQKIAANRACAIKSGPDHLLLNLLPRRMSKRYGFPRGIFGFALPTAKGAPGNKISLFFERVLDLAYYGNVGTSFHDAQAIILGHMIVHEVGHLLLGPNSHSSRGIMRFPWDRRTLTNLERGRLKFSAAQRSKIRKELQRRFELRQAMPD